MELHLECRPKTFDEFIGNAPLIKSLRSTIGRKHVYLFHGERGCGKTTLARLVADELGVKGFDLFELNAADATGVDDARMILANVSLLPIEGDRKMYIIDEVHRFTANAQDALLKILEEPPEHVYFVLCTTNPGKLVSTIRSRSGDAFRVSRLKRKEIQGLLQSAIDNYIEWGIDDKVVSAIIEAADGIPRDALVLLDMVMEMKDVDEALEVIKGGVDAVPEVGELCRLLLMKRKGKWDTARKILKEIDDDAETTRRRMLGYFAKVLLDSESDHVANLMEEFLDNVYDSGQAGLVLAVYRSCLI